MSNHVVGCACELCTSNIKLRGSAFKVVVAEVEAGKPGDQDATIMIAWGKTIEEALQEALRMQKKTVRGGGR